MLAIDLILLYSARTDYFFMLLVTSFQVHRNFARLSRVAPLMQGISCILYLCRDYVSVFPISSFMRSHRSVVSSQVVLLASASVQYPLFLLSITTWSAVSLSCLEI